MIDTKRSSILDAIKILDDLVNDLVVGTMVFNNYQSKFSSGQLSKQGIVAVQKMCVSHLILGLNKLCEFWEVYHQLVPAELRPVVKPLITKLQKGDIREFRNTFVAHVRDKKLGRVKTQFEVVDLLNSISDNDPSSFLLWLNNHDDNEYPKTVSSIVETLRDHLREEYNVTEDEIFQR